MTKKILYTLMASAAVALSSSASASTITNLDLINASPFGGFDWSQNGTAVSTPGPVYTSGDSITTYYFADAVAINQTGGGVFSTPDMLTAAPGTSFTADTYEYTIVATIFETVTCGAIGTICTGSATFTPTGGLFDIYYDNAALSNTVADQVDGTGFTDGANILSGTIAAGGGGTFDPTTGTGVFSFSGTVLTTNATYITPDQSGTFAIATLQFGDSTTNWTAPTGTPFGALPADFIDFQADGNQEITAAVPEPGTLTLLGLGMLGLVVGAQKRKSK